MSTVEIGVIHHILDHFVLSTCANLFSLFHEWSYLGPVDFVIMPHFELVMLKRSFPIVHELIVFSLNTFGPLLNELRVIDHDIIIVHTVGARYITCADINMLGGCRGCYNLVFTDDLLSIFSCSVLLRKGNNSNKW